jgi:hypothetical protein
MNWRVPIIVIATLFVALYAGVLAAPETQALKIKHLEKLQVGPYALNVGFSEFPMLAERSADITLNPEGGISNKTGSYKITMPSGEIYDEAAFLPRFARQRTIWGFDSRAFPEEGQWLLEITIKGGQGTHTAKIPIEVGARPAGPSNTLILALASLPILALLILIFRSWRQVRPLRHTESQAW